MKMANIKKLDKSITMQITVGFTREFRYRVYVSLAFIRLAAWILGCNINVNKIHTDGIDE